MTTCLTKLRKENRFPLAHSLRVQSIVWLAGQQECEAAGYTALTSGEQERQTPQLHTLCLPLLSGTSVHEMVLPTFTIDLPTSITLPRKSIQTCPGSSNHGAFKFTMYVLCVHMGFLFNNGFIF